MTKPSDNEKYKDETAMDMAGLTIPVDEQRCPTCRTKIVVPDEEGLVIKNAILPARRAVRPAPNALDVKPGWTSR